MGLKPENRLRLKLRLRLVLRLSDGALVLLLLVAVVSLHGAIFINVRVELIVV